MSDEIEDKGEVAPPETPTNPYEERALQMGWRPKEEFDGEDDDFVDAKEYVQRAPLFEKIRSSSKRTEALEKSVQELLKLNSKIEENAYKRALDELKAKQKEALNEGDLQEYHSIGEKIEKVKEDRPVVPKQVATQDTSEFDTWVEKNSWYGDDEVLTAFADGLGPKLANQGLSKDAVLREIEKKVKTTFPDKFRNPNRERAGVESPGRNKNVTQEKGYALNDFERQAMRTFVQAGVMSEKDYIDQLKRAKKEA